MAKRRRPERDPQPSWVEKLVGMDRRREGVLGVHQRPQVGPNRVQTGSGTIPAYVFSLKLEPPAP